MNAIFPDAVLITMAELTPSNMDVLRFIPGVNPAQAEKYGAEFLKVTQQYAQSLQSPHFQTKIPKMPLAKHN